MRLHCIAGRHEVAPGEIRNQGLEFSSCRRCGCDMVRSKLKWRVVPAGFRVVWKGIEPRRTEISAMQFLLDLPSSGRALTVLSRRDGNRALGLLDLLLTGLRSLAWEAAARLQAWRGTLLTRKSHGPFFQLSAPATSEHAA